jgi:hypothetical protein
MTVKKEVNMTSKKKMGRPTDNPKRIKLSVRVDEKTLELLDGYCKRKGITRMEGIRQGIQRLRD